MINYKLAKEVGATHYKTYKGDILPYLYRITNGIVDIYEPLYDEWYPTQLSESDIIPLDFKLGE